METPPIPPDRDPAGTGGEDPRMAELEARLRELSDRKAFLAALVESSEDAIIAKALDGTITFWNEAATRLFGWTREEAEGRPVTLIFPEERLEEEPGILAQVRKGEQVTH